jgi:hypothetical protein
MKLIYSLLAVLFLLAACQKKEWSRRTSPENQDLSGKAFIKLHNIVLGSPNTLLTIDGNKVTGNVVGYGGFFPAASSNYLAIDAGTHHIRFKDTARVERLNIEINGTFEAGKYYSVIMHDTLQTATYRIVPDMLTVPTDTSAQIRLINFAWSSAPMANIDLYSKNLRRNVFTDLPSPQFADFVKHPSKSADTFYVRSAGTTTNLAEAILTPGEKRNYTLLFMGKFRESTGTSGRKLNVITN